VLDLPVNKLYFVYIYGMESPYKPNCIVQYYIHGWIVT